MNTPPVKTKKLAGCHFWDKQPLSAMITPTTKTSQAALEKQSTPLALANGVQSRNKLVKTPRRTSKGTSRPTINI